MERDPEIYEFEAYTLDIANRRLLHDGDDLALGSRYFDALVMLVRAEGELVTKTAFMDTVWKGVPVTDEALTQCIRTLRRTLGDVAGAPRFIATVPKHGYRFVYPIRTRAAPFVELKARTQWSGRLVWASTYGGGLAGLIGGSFYGVIGNGPWLAVVLLAILAACLGVLGGAGVGSGLEIAARLVPGRQLLLPLGGGLGGMTVGAVGQLLSLEGVSLLTGQTALSVAGLVEGALLGSAAGLGAEMASRLRRSWVFGLALLGIGLVAGWLVVALGGRLFAASVYNLQARFPDAARMIEQVGWGSVVFETMLFVTAIGMAVRHSMRDDGRTKPGVGSAFLPR